MTSYRRVVTGEVDGKAVFASDETVEGMAPLALGGAEMHSLWGSDTGPALPDAGHRPTHEGWFPRPGGYRFILFSIPTDAAAETHPGHPDPEAGFAEVEAAFPGLVSHMEPDAPGMHTTNSTDLSIVISGTITLELSDGVTKTLSPGDTYIQNGTRHRWTNQGDVPAVVASVLMGGSRTDPS